MGATSRSTSPGQGKSVPRVVHVVRAGNLAAAAAAAVAIGTRRFASIFSMAGSGWTGSRLFVLLASSQPGEGMQTLARRAFSEQTDGRTHRSRGPHSDGACGHDVPSGIGQQAPGPG